MQPHPVSPAGLDALQCEQHVALRRRRMPNSTYLHIIYAMFSDCCQRFRATRAHLSKRTHTPPSASGGDGGGGGNLTSARSRSRTLDVASSRNSIQPQTYPATCRARNPHPFIHTSLRRGPWTGRRSSSVACITERTTVLRCDDGRCWRARRQISLAPAVRGKKCMKEWVRGR